MKLINKSTHTLKNLDIDKDKDKILKATEGVRKTLLTLHYTHICLEEQI